MSLQLCHETFLDGIILIFQDFRALKFCKNFMLPSNVVLQRILNTHYRASTIISYYKKLTKVGFGVHNEMPLEFLVAFRKMQIIQALDNVVGSSDSDDDEQTANQNETAPKNEFSTIHKSFVNAINYSASELGCLQYQCCKSYEEIIKRRACSCFNN